MSEHSVPPPSEWGDVDSEIPFSEEDLIKRQNLPLALVGGFLGALLGAAIWAGITALISMQIGYIAIGVGFLAGLGVRMLGKGYQTHFGIIGALFGVFGCALGNVAALGMIFAQQQGLPMMDVLLPILLSPSEALDVLVKTFGFMDIVFYGLAGYFAFKTSFHDPYG